MAPRPPTRQFLTPGGRIDHHGHGEAYVAIVLAGEYEEAGETGRRRLLAGEAAIHEAFAGHCNIIGVRGAMVLNLPAPGLVGGFGLVSDPDALARLAERDAPAAAALLAQAIAPVAAATTDWPDELAAALIEDPQLSLGAWASARSLAPETLSRGFSRAFGVTPKRFRYEARTRRALRGLCGAEPLARVALEAGFADQTHMTHAVHALTGAPPGVWRRSSRDKTGA
ncbi:MAG: helix-turn-helix domain-containing protein [Phenylobacterium sp.]|uniref:helix-turn-helix domain-containing protein n=1 Tax=Phenylobacterium sp. TaxID=1871053 RepID=UPI003918EBC6